jgi:uncharacterized membrane protein
VTERNLRIAIIVLCAIGIADSIYLASIHFESVPLVCSSSGVVDCSQVLHSKYSEIAGIPVALFGLAWFVVMALLALRPIGWAALAWTGIGVASVIYLVYVELFRIDKICLWCTVAHVLVIAILGLVLVLASAPGREPAAPRSAAGSA